MSFSGDDVEGLYVPNDADKLDLSTSRGRSDGSFSGYIVNDTPGGIHSPFYLVGLHLILLLNATLFRHWQVILWPLYSLATTYVAKVLTRPCGIMVIIGSTPQSMKIQYFSEPSELTSEILCYYCRSYSVIRRDWFLFTCELFFRSPLGKHMVLRLRDSTGSTTLPYHRVGRPGRCVPAFEAVRQAKPGAADWQTQIEQWVQCMDFAGHNWQSLFFF